MQTDHDDLAIRLKGEERPGLADDLYHRLMEASWARLLLIVVGTYLALNALFAGLYLLGDSPVANARPGSFVDAFFFSVQAFSTIGFGNMYPQTPYAHCLVTAETLLGLLALATTTGLVFAKFSLPSARVRFSRAAVISDYEGVPTLRIRMANERGNKIVDASVDMALLRDERSAEGEVFRRIHDLRLVRGRSPVFEFSWTLFHPIDEGSPLHGWDTDLSGDREGSLLVILTGLDGTHHQTIHARSTYALGEVRRQHRFVDILSRDPDGTLVIDMDLFDETEPVGV